MICLDRGQRAIRFWKASQLWIIPVWGLPMRTLVHEVRIFHAELPVERLYLSF